MELSGGHSAYAEERPILQGERERAQQMIADMRAQQENEQALKEQELSAAQAQLMARQQEAEQQGSRLKEAAVSFQPTHSPKLC